ncbi:MAG: hypothetical protein U1F49_01150 [Rubrivivax sp.]
MQPAGPRCGASAAPGAIRPGPCALLGARRQHAARPSPPAAATPAQGHSQRALVQRHVVDEEPSTPKSSRELVDRAGHRAEVDEDVGRRARLRPDLGAVVEAAQRDIARAGFVGGRAHRPSKVKSEPSAARITRFHHRGC